MYRQRRYRWLAFFLAALLGMLLSGTALAAEFANDEVYRLEAGEVVSDDLYVAGNEVYIAGTVEGDLIAAGSTVEVAGTVQGDVIAAGSSVIISGNVQDDVRVAGAGVEVTGTIGDDLFAAAGGNSVAPMPGINPAVRQGIHLGEASTIGGDAVLAGGAGDIAGTVAGDLRAFMETITLAAQVEGDAELGGDTIDVQDTTSIAGTLHYRSDARADIPEGVASEVTFTEMTPEEEEASRIEIVLGWLWRTVLILIGFALLGWLLLRFAPGVLTRPASALDERPVAAGLYGLAATVLLIFIPLLSALLVFVMVLFGGWFAGLVLGFFLFGTLALLWFLSPLVTGIWLGQRMRSLVGENRLVALLVGVLIIALLAQIPFVGWFVYLVSFIFALGALLIMPQRAATQPMPA